MTTRLRPLLALASGFLLFSALSCGQEEKREPTSKTPAETPATAAQGDPVETGSEPATGTPPAAAEAPAEQAVLGVVERDEEFGYSFRPPRLFQRGPDTFVQQARTALLQSAGANSAYFTVPRMIFAVSGTDARIFVGEFSSGTDGAAADWARGYLDAARMKAGDANFASAPTRVAGRDGYLIRIEDEAFRNDRVLFPTKRGSWVQIDFLLPRAGVADLEGSIAASIASIETF